MTTSTAERTRRMRVPASDGVGTVEVNATENEGARAWAYHLMMYIVGTWDGTRETLTLDELRREAMKRQCPTYLRDRAQFYCASLYRDRVMCDGVRWYPVEITVHTAGAPTAQG